MKKRIQVKLFVLSLLPVLAACSTADQSAVKIKEEAVKNTLVKMWAAIENEDIELYLSYIHPDFTQFGETDPILRVGKEAEVKGTKEWVESSSNIHTEMEEPRVVIRGDVAWITYYWKDFGFTNGEPFASRGKSTRIFVFENSKWLCIHGHYTLISPIYAETTSNKETLVLPVSSGSLERIQGFKSQFVNTRDIDVWLPESYDTNKKSAVLYMWDGQMLFDGTKSWNQQEWGVDEVMTKLLQYGSIKDCIVVALTNAGDGRYSEYFPKKSYETLSEEDKESLKKQMASYNLDLGEIQSDNILKFMVYELKPYIDHHYSTEKGFEHTFIGGSSMGGLMSVYALCEYPNIFGGAACLSTHWPIIFTPDDNEASDAFLNYLKNNLPDAGTHKLYFDYGTETLDSLYEPFQKQADEIMRTKGFTGANWKTLKFQGHDHSEASWNKRLHIPLQFLLAE